MKSKKYITVYNIEYVNKQTGEVNDLQFSDYLCAVGFMYELSKSPYIQGEVMKKEIIINPYKKH